MALVALSVDRFVCVFALKKDSDFATSTVESGLERFGDPLGCDVSGLDAVSHDEDRVSEFRSIDLQIDEVPV
jgi:hypothetical protein